MSSLEYRKSKRGRIFQCLKNINRRCLDKDDTHFVYYGEKGVKNLLTYDDLSFLWDRDGASQMKQPSIDRINNNGHYCLENCRYIEQSENRNKDSKIPVLQIELCGNFVKRYESMSEASKNGFTRQMISWCCQGKRKTHGGFRWEYAYNKEFLNGCNYRYTSKKY